MRKKKVMSKNSLSFWLLAGWLNNACTSLHFSVLCQTFAYLINTEILPKASPLQLILGISSITILTFKCLRSLICCLFFLEKKVILSFHTALPMIWCFHMLASWESCSWTYIVLSRVIIPVCCDGVFLVDGENKVCLSDNASPTEDLWVNWGNH